jgi:hypothetical protein
MELLMRAYIQSGRVLRTWKAPQMTLICKKRDREDITNWRPISITNCLHRIFTWLITRPFETVNSNVHIYSDSQKGFVKKTNRRNDYGTMLNELLHSANQDRENLVVTAIDFTNAFGSGPRARIMSVIRQRNLPNLMQRIVESRQ